MNEWIKVRDRLPQQLLGKFLLFTDGTEVFFGRYFYGNSHKDECLWKAEIGWVDKDSDITHWMPLPEPPK